MITAKKIEIKMVTPQILLNKEVFTLGESFIICS